MLGGGLPMNRREFLKSAAATTAILRMSQVGFSQESGSTNPSRIPTREYGKTGVHFSIIAFGGIVVMNAEQPQADRAVAEAVERGVNYFDVAPSYGDAEIKLGPALEPYRQRVFLAGKTTDRTRAGAAAELKRTLER